MYFFTFLYFCLMTFKIQHEARCSEQVWSCFVMQRGTVESKSHGTPWQKVTSRAMSPQCSWRGLVLSKYVLHGGWLCTTSMPAFFQRDVVHWLFMYMQAQCIRWSHLLHSNETLISALLFVMKSLHSFVTSQDVIAPDLERKNQHTKWKSVDTSYYSKHLLCKYSGR